MLKSLAPRQDMVKLLHKFYKSTLPDLYTPKRWKSPTLSTNIHSNNIWEDLIKPLEFVHQKVAEGLQVSKRP